MKNNYQIKKLTDIEVITGFSEEARKLLPKNISLWEKIIVKKKKEIIGLITFVNNQDTDDFTKYFCKLIIKMYKMPKLMRCTNILFHLEIQWSLLNPTSKNFYIPNLQRQIEIAKEFPIYELARDSLELQPSGRNFKALCFLHEEKHASLIFFPSTNTFYCFSCNTGGDNIKFIMALHGISFPEAVRMLNQKYGK